MPNRPGSSSPRRRRNQREKDLTSRLFSGDLDEDRLASGQRFSDRNKHAQHSKMERTAGLRADAGVVAADIETLPIGQVVQVYSRFCDVDHPTGLRRCVTRKTLSKMSITSIVVGDRVRFRDTGSNDETGKPEAVIELALPRDTILTRAGSFHDNRAQPIVANAEQMLIVVSLMQPMVKWGLVDRMLVAAESGKLVPIVCLNKVDLAEMDDRARRQFTHADEVLAHYASMEIATVRTSAAAEIGLDELAKILANHTTVLAGHSGVGKSSLITAIQPDLDIRVGEVSVQTEKGRHTTTSGRRYPLKIGGFVIDTPGVKDFGLWDVTAENLTEYFPDVQAGNAPPWRQESFERIAESLR
jgi:ribosome biogenesis GTPase